MATGADILARTRRQLLSLPVAIAAGLLGFYAIAGFFLAPYLIKGAIPRFADEKLQAKASVTRVRVNPFLLTLELKDFRLSERDDLPLLAFDRLFVDLEVSSLVRWAWTFSDITLEHPEVALDINPEGQLNLARLIERLAKSGSAAGANKDASPPRMLIHRAAITRGSVSLSDRSDATPARATVDPITFELHEISTLPDQRGDYALSARLPAGATLSWRGKLSLQPMASAGEFGIQDLKVATVWNFLRDELAVEEPGGTVTLGLRYDTSYGSGAMKAAADGITLRAKDLSITPRGAKAPILALAEIDLPGGTADLAKRAAHFPKLGLRGGTVAFAADASGVSDWQRVFVNDEGAAKPVKKRVNGNQGSWRVGLDQIRVEDLALRFADESRVRPLLVETEKAALELALSLETGDQVKLSLEKISAELTKPRIGSADGEAPLITFDKASVSGGTLDLGSRSAAIEAIHLAGGATRAVREANGALPITELFAAKTSKPDDQAPFDFSIGRLEVSGHTLEASDRGTDPAIGYDLTGTSVRLENIARQGNQPLKFDLGARIRQGGSLRATGSFNMDRARAEGRLELSRLALVPLEPLLSRHVVLKLASGSASANGRFIWGREGKGAGVRYTGTAAVDGLLISEPGGERFLSWKSLAASGVKLDSGGGRYTIEDVRLLEPGAKLVINKDRTVNVSGVLRERERPSTAAESAAPSTAAPPVAADTRRQPDFAIAVNRVRVEKGALDFADLSLVLPFSTQIRDLGGSITGLASEPGTRAGVKLEGQVEDYGLARIDGTINLFEPKAHTDLNVVFRNVQMTPLSPYAATFAGRRIASGRLSLDLQYKLSDGQLQGENKVLLEQFTLGERVESPSALQLPLDLAIAILTDSEGRIDIAVPVRGNVDHPEFSYGHLVWQAIRTLLTRIVTAPFRALASIFGGGTETLEDIAFDVGSDRLLPPEREKLMKLGETMKKRPQLKLVVQGRYHTVRDGAALREAALRRSVAEQLEVKLGPGEDPGPVSFDNAKTQRALEALLAARSGPEAAAQFSAAFGREKGREATRVNPVLALVGRASPDRELYEAMYRRLIELQPLPDTALPNLARQRGVIILKQLADGSGLGPEHVGEKDPEPSSDAVTAKLSLDVAKKPDAPQESDNAGTAP